MANFKTDGIILTTYDFEEADKLVKIFSREKGIVSAIAKGIKKPTSKKSHFVETLTYGSFYFAKGKNLDLFLEIKPYDNLLESISGQNINFIFYFAEVILKTTTEDSYDSFYFDEVAEIRSHLGDYLFHAILKLQIEALKHMGSWPEIRRCVRTEKLLNEKRYFSSHEIGYNINEGQAISNRIIKQQIFLSENVIGECIKLQIENEDFLDILNTQNHWIELSIDNKINSFRFINE
jgi:DNA repair protein RecO (recombination protein O)